MEHIRVESKNLIHPIGILEPKLGVNFNDQLSDLIFQETGLWDIMTDEGLFQLNVELTSQFIGAAPDLKADNLAKDHVEKLILSATEKEGVTKFDLLKHGAQEFYKVGKDVLGPLWASYVHEALQTAQEDDTYLFAARDATPMYWVAEAFKGCQKTDKDLSKVAFVHVDWNRWFMAQKDEMDGSGEPLNFQTNPMLREFYTQMGFLNGNMVKIIEPGAWGSAANALKTMLPKQQFELRFMFSHMPQNIYGFLNDHCPNIDPLYFEIINDTAEAVPKPYIRPTKLIQHNGHIVADLSDKIMDSPYMRIWSWAVNQGAIDAAINFDENNFSILEHVKKVIELSKLSAKGKWTGVLPKNTPTWSEGEAWVANWQHGKIPPLK